MFRLRTSAPARLVLFLSCTAAAIVHAQTSLDPNEGLRMTKSSTPGTMEMSWFGKANTTYFIQHTPLLESGVWSYLPYVDQGGAAVITYGLSEPAPGGRSFFRLRYRAGASDHPKTDDFDGDGVANMDELQLGLDPLDGSTDTDGDGLPDDFEWAYFGGLAETGGGDYDGDGVTNRAEYLAHRHPNTSIHYGTITYKYAGESPSGDVVYMTDFSEENSLSVTYIDSNRTKVSAISVHPNVIWGRIAYPESFVGGVVPVSATYTAVAGAGDDISTLAFQAYTTVSEGGTYTGRDLLREVDGMPYSRELAEGGVVHRVAKYLAITSLPLEIVSATGFPAIIRDFPYRSAETPDFGSGNGEGGTTGFVEPLLGADGLPVSTLTDEQPARKIYSAESFSKWYRQPDAVSVNMILKEGEGFTEGYQYGFRMNQFFPFTAVLKDVGGDRSRFCYTSEVHAKLAYDVSATSENPTRLVYASDDDCWIFINGRLITESVGFGGGSGNFYLRDISHGLTGDTGVCDLAIFHAERLENNGELTFMSSTALTPIYAYQVLADSHSSAPVQFSLDAGAPAGMTIDPNTGKLLWDYSGFAFGTYPVTIRVADGNHNEDMQTLHLLVGAKPTVIIQPGGAEGYTSVQMGHDLTLTAVATGYPAPTYQWYYLSDPIPGATEATLTIEDAGDDKVGNYGVRVSNVIGASTAKEVYVSVYE